MRPPRPIFLVDASAADRALYRQYLQQDALQAYEILEWESGEGALQACQINLPHLILLNYQLPDMDGLEFLYRLRLQLGKNQVPVLVLADQGNEAIAVQVLKSGAQDYLKKKDLTCEGVQRAVRSALERMGLMEQIRQQREQQHLINTIALRIRRSLQLQEVLDTAVGEVRQLLQTDRVLVYQFQANMGGKIVAESVSPPWLACLNAEIQDTCFQSGIGEAYLQGRIWAVADIYSTELSPCHRALLEEFQVKANLVVPILLENAATAELPNREVARDLGSPWMDSVNSLAGPPPPNLCLWGLLISHQCNAPRQWQESELGLLDQLAVQLAIAIQQAELYRNLEILNANLERKVEERTTALRQSEAMNRAILEAIPDWLVRMNSRGDYLFVTNEDAIALLKPVDDLVGCNVHDLIPAPLAQQRMAYIQQALETGQVQAYEYEIEVQGDLRCEEARIAVIGADEVLLMVRDITDRKQTERALQTLNAELERRVEERTAALKQAESKYRLLIEQIPGVVYISPLRAAPEHAYISPYIQHLLEISAAEWSAGNFSKWTDYIHPADRERVLQELDLAISAAVPFLSEYRMVTGTGKTIWVRDEAMLVTLEDRQTQVLQGIAIDITDRIQVEVALQHSEEQFRTTFNEAPIGMLLANIETYRFTRTNRVLQQMLGYTAAELAQISYLDITHPDDREIDTYFIQQSIQGEISRYQLEKRYLTKNGRVLWVNFTATLLHDRDGGRLYGLGMVEDITERRQAAAQLRQTNERLERANQELERATRLKDEFLATMSHELRTPLNAILGMSEGLQDQVYGVLTDRQRKVVVTIEQSGRHLLELINDILDLSKIEAGMMELTLSPVYVKALCDSSLAFVRQQALKKNISLDCSIQSGISLIEVDERRLRQVLINLLMNAVKFTPAGGSVTLKVKLIDWGAKSASIAAPFSSFLEDASPNVGFLAFIVEDTGIGIASEHLGRLFQPFVQIDSSLSRQYSGTGLGLALVKQIMELHGGGVSVTSVVGQGSCFTVTLPCSSEVRAGALDLDPLSTELPNLIGTPVSVTAPLVLLAEDNLFNIDMMSDYLKSQGYRLILAENGQVAIDQAKTHKPDIILMDIQMPEMDGLEATRQIRADRELTAIPIIALTALAMPSDREKCLAAGVNEYMAKPVSLRQLGNKIQALLNG
ncbi:hypothetical protein BST81_19290 [Leptolyngbya sp. 'hensonii']|uniref:response regulator n=1 Tax=Leptolyngbya sp. 'hensonii' TaxID=1922337 RepID=UPI00094F9762|nr:response regulator [Leptolyngbya sp. 'hensonii']OLP16841.1 hypothetical protein BST81_19290 [Leptolyngbya sp. 'hensonii']